MTDGRATELDRFDVHETTFEPLRKGARMGTTQPDRTRTRSAKAKTIERRAERRRKGER